ncbi:MAG: right-handed parallel beta-helix repeat-containing protein [Lachnospiraceae bacterium]|nr:right-handed parallel beta-helix repeat-containing protein [Lachnospiraceae bacterium]
MKKAGYFLLLTFIALCFIGISIPKAAFAASYAKTINVKLKDGQDATDAIQKALDEAAKAGTKKKQALVKVPAGEYYISKTLVIGSNTYLKLDKNTYIRKNPKAKDPILHMLHTKQGSKGKYSDNSRITVQGGTWDTEFIRYNETSSGSIFMFAHTNTLKILDVTLCNSYGTHLIELGGVKNCTIKNCTLYGFEAPAGDVDKEAIQIDVCHSDSILPCGEPYDDSPCTGITISGCEIYGYPRAIGSHMMVEGIYHKNIKILDNNIHDISAAAVYGYNYANLTISMNIMENVCCGIQLKTDSVAKKTILTRNKGVKAMKISKNNFKINISDNTITLDKEISQDKADSGTSIGVFIYGSEKYPMKNVAISDNTITCNSSGVYLRFIDDSTISGNIINRHENVISVENTKFAEDAIKLLSSCNAVIDDNYISSSNNVSFENGIALRDGSTNAVLNRNEINSTTKSGLGIYDNSSVSGGSGTIINNSGLNGITIVNSGVTLYNSTISDSAEHGISVRNGGFVELNDCTVTGSKSNGINIAADSSARLKGGQVSFSSGKGVNLMASATLYASDLQVINNTGKGVDIAENCVAELYDCIISENSANGIFVDGENSETTITGCTIKNNSASAIQLKNGLVHISNNSLINNCLGETDGKAVAVFAGISGEITNNSFSNPNTKFELFIASDVILTPYLSTVKRTMAYGYTDIGGNTFN